MRRRDLKASQCKQLNSNRVLSLPTLVLLCALSFTSTGHAQQTFKLSVSDVLSTSSEGFDFRHVEVATTSGAAAAKDVTVWCHVQIQDRLNRAVGLVRPIPITLKAGQNSIERDLYLPPKGLGGETLFSLDPNLRDKNKQLESLFANSILADDDVLVIHGPQSSSQAVPVFETVFDRKRRLPQTRLMATTSKELTYYRYVLSSGDAFVASRKYWSVDFLPKRWIGYTCLEQVVIDSGTLLQLRQDAERFDALMHWVAMGGTLVVWDCKDDFGNVPEVMHAVSSARSARVANLQFFEPSLRLENNRASFIDASAASDQRVFNSDLSDREDGRTLLSRRESEIWGENFFKNWKEVSIKKGEAGSLGFDTDSDLLLHRLAKGKIFFNSVAFDESSETQRLSMRFLCGGPRHFRLMNFLGDQSSLGKSYNPWQLIDVGAAPTGLFVFVVVAFMLLI